MLRSLHQQSPLGSCKVTCNQWKTILEMGWDQDCWSITLHALCRPEGGPCPPPSPPQSDPPSVPLLPSTDNLLTGSIPLNSVVCAETCLKIPHLIVGQTSLFQQLQLQRSLCLPSLLLGCHMLFGTSSRCQPPATKLPTQSNVRVVMSK